MISLAQQAVWKAENTYAWTKIETMSHKMKIHVYHLGGIGEHLPPWMITLLASAYGLLGTNRNRYLQMLQSKVDPSGEESRRYG